MCLPNDVWAWNWEVEAEGVAWGCSWLAEVTGEGWEHSRLTGLRVDVKNKSVHSFQDMQAVADASGDYW